jgi:epoxide hydrolase 4
VLLHGWPEFWAAWEPIFARLAGRYRLIAPDFRGFGESENPHPGPTDTVNAVTLADDIVALLDAMDIGRCSFVGHDVGSNVMQVLGVSFAARATGLFFFNCATHGVGSRWNEPGHINQIWYQTFHQMHYAAVLVASSRESCRAYIGHFLRHWSHRKDAFDVVLDRWVDNFMRPGNMQGGFNWYIGQNAGRLAVMAGTAQRPPKITVPTRVLWGRHDRLRGCLRRFAGKSSSDGTGWSQTWLSARSRRLHRPVRLSQRGHSLACVSGGISALMRTTVPTPMPSVLATLFKPWPLRSWRSALRSISPLSRGRPSFLP